ncbi:MAG: DNA gyrase subunit A [Patescibacteria group bacterium]|jgi:DNA gyrase subunit A
MPEETEIENSNIGRIQIQHVEDEVQKSYLDYAMSVIVARALPDVRDGMKPVHRRVIYAMHKLNLTASARYQKSAAVVGQVMKDFHPHGDLAIYDTVVRMAQDFSMRYTMVDGQGNFGSVDGDGAAAMRYTECRMAKITAEMLQDIDKNTVNWVPNYDGRLQEPKVLPAKIPQLLLNGSVGIAVGMATNIPPHNLTELCDGIIHLIDNGDATIDELMQFIKGPDFPTGGIIYNLDDIKTAFSTGRGRIIIRAVAEIEEDKRGQNRIIISQIPYQVNKSTLVSKIADLVKEKRIEGISDLRDESDRTGMRIVVELKTSGYPKKILNQLYELTQMQVAFHVNMLALTPNLEPRTMTLKEMLEFFIVHRVEVLTRRTEFELGKAKDRLHILEGLKIALDHLDEVINTIRASKDRADAKVQLMAKFKLSELQTDAILEMRLAQLAALERQKIEDEYEAVKKEIARLEDLLAHPEKIRSIIKAELAEIKEKYGDPRKTTIVPHALDKFVATDLIPDEQVVVSITRDNYIKRVPTSTYQSQIRGGKGVIGMTTKDEDQVDRLIIASTHDDLLFFTNKGRIFQTKVYEIPSSSRQAKGQALVNIIQISSTEKVTSVLTLNAEQKKSYQYFLFATVKGTVKKSKIADYANVRKTGLIAINLDKSDELRWVRTTTGSDKVIEVSSNGQAIYFDETDVRVMGRSAAGVRGMKLRANDSVMAMDVVSNTVNADPDLLIVLENGFGKRTALSHFTLQQRGGIGMRAANCTDRTGHIIGMYVLNSNNGDVLMISQRGQVLRTKLNTIKRLGRDTQGVTMMKLPNDDKVASVTIIYDEPGDAIETKAAKSPVKKSNPVKKSAATTKKALAKKPTKAKAKPAPKKSVAKSKPAAKKSKPVTKSQKPVTKSKLVTKSVKPIKESKPAVKIKVETPKPQIKIHDYQQDNK